MTTPDRHKKVSELFLAACKLPPDERSAYLDATGGGDNSLRAEVEAMLARDDARTGFLDPPT